MTYPQRLLHSFQELSVLVLTRETVRSTLDVLSDLAVQTIPVCDIASVSLVGVGRSSTVGASDDIAVALDAIQCDTGMGPSLDAIEKDAKWFRINEMSIDTKWPAFSAKAAEQGFESLLAFTLRIDQDTLGVLNLYAREVEAFTDEDVDNGAIYAAHAAVALAHAQSRSHRAVVKELDEAMVTQEIIARAVGILMDKEFRNADEALDLLEERAEQLKGRLRDSAQAVLVAADRERADLELPDGFANRVMGRARET